MNQKTNSKRNRNTLAIILLLLFTLLLFTGCGQDNGSSNDQDTPGDAGEKTCTIQINCSLLVGEDLTGTGLETLVPDNGVILKTTEVTLSAR